jgi:hypothetical protein
MCIIAICEDRKLTKTEAENCFKNNNDGAGIGWAEKGFSRYSKGLMSFDEFWYVYESINVLPHVVHFRNETSGGVCPQLTHPFNISEESKVYLDYEGKDPLLFHNGVLTGWDNALLDFYIKKCAKIPDGEWSDSRFVAVLVHHLGKMVLKFKHGGKYVLVSPDGNITIFGDFETVKGVRFSNNSYEKYSYRRGFVGYGGSYDGLEWIYGEDEGYAGKWGGGLKSNDKVVTTTKNSTKDNWQKSKSALLNKPSK